MSVAGLYNCGNGSNSSIVHVRSTILQHIGVHAAF